MNNLLEKFEKKQIENLTSKKRIPAFRPGDTIKVTLKITEGDKSRLQSFEGMCIARKNNSVNSKFTLRKISHGEGVERVFPLFSANIDKIEVIRKGNVKRAKLYYLRDRTGKSARIADRDRGDEVDQYAMTKEEVISEDSSKETSIEATQTESIEQSAEPKAEEEQIKKEASEITIKLIRNPDILASKAARPSPPFIVGFAAETEGTINNARNKLERKKVDLMIANHIEGKDKPFGSDRNALVLIDQNTEFDLGQDTKINLARILVTEIAKRFHAKNSTEST